MAAGSPMGARGRRQAAAKARGGDFQSLQPRAPVGIETINEALEPVVMIPAVATSCQKVRPEAQVGVGEGGECARKWRYLQAERLCRH